MIRYALVLAGFAWIIFANERTPRWAVCMAWGVVAFAAFATLEGWF